MTIIRSYFKKNNTLIGNNLTNNSQNPVTEISYGTDNKQVSRFIFDVDFDKLNDLINKGLINVSNVKSHTLHMTNTISNAPKYIGGKSYTDSIDRASSFNLDIFNINENWSEGSGYDMDFKSYPNPPYGDTYLNNARVDASNWFYNLGDSEWNVYGVYDSGNTEIIKTQEFQVGNEDINVDLTDYINQRLFSTGITSYSGDSYGLGIKFGDYYENIATKYRQAVAFHTKYTNTWYEPYIETIIDDEIHDDRNYFYLNKENELYFYSNKDVDIDRVEISDNDDEVVDIISGGSITKVRTGIFKIKYTVSSNEYLDSVLFTDNWYVKYNNRIISTVNEFYLLPEENYFGFDNNNIEFDNYYFYFWGLNQGEKLIIGDKRKIHINVRELYNYQNNNSPLDIEYRLFTSITNNHEIDVIPFTKVDRTNRGFEITLDCSWLIPQKYKIQLRLVSGNVYKTKETIEFNVISDGKLIKY